MYKIRSYAWEKEFGPESVLIHLNTLDATEKSPLFGSAILSSFSGLHKLASYRHPAKNLPQAVTVWNCSHLMHPIKEFPRDYFHKKSPVLISYVRFSCSWIEESDKISVSPHAPHAPISALYHTVLSAQEKSSCGMHASNNLCRKAAFGIECPKTKHKQTHVGIKNWKRDLMVIQENLSLKQDLWMELDSGNQWKPDNHKIKPQSYTVILQNINPK